MGRRPKGTTKYTPYSLEHLTEKQGDLLAWVYLAGYQGISRSEILWSAKEYLGRSPTQSEAATLTKRMKTLEAYELVNRSGRFVSLTDEGRWKLYAYAVESPKSWTKQQLLVSLERDKTARQLEAYGDFLIAAWQHCEGDYDKLTAIRDAIEPVAQSLRQKQHLEKLKLEAMFLLERKRNGEAPELEAMSILPKHPPRSPYPAETVCENE